MARKNFTTAKLPGNVDSFLFCSGLRRVEVASSVEYKLFFLNKGEIVSFCVYVNTPS